MPDGTIRPDASKIAGAVSVFRDSGERIADVTPVLEDALG